LCIYSQHIPGVANKIADILSQRFVLSDDQLTAYVCPYLPPQVQASIKLYPVHPEIISWMTCWLQKCSKMKGLHKTPRIRNAEFGDDGEHTQMPSASLRISGCPALHQNNEPISLELLPLLSGEESFLDQTTSAWLRQQSKRPWQNWVRSLGQTWGTTPHMDQDYAQCTHYLPANSEECET
jgi:hypothetical protein